MHTLATPENPLSTREHYHYHWESFSNPRAYLYHMIINKNVIRWCIQSLYGLVVSSIYCNLFKLLLLLQVVYAFSLWQVSLCYYLAWTFFFTSRLACLTGVSSQYKMTITPESMTFNGSALWRDVILLYSVSFDTLSVCLMFTTLLRNFHCNTSTLFGRPLDSVQSSELYMKTFTM